MSPRVRLRSLGPGEYAVLDGVFAGLSAASRYRRFHAGLPRLTPAVRDRLVAVDDRRHLAVAAFADGAPVGIARLIALGEGRAEIAVEVVDAWQRRGVGLRLVRAVAVRGRRAGFREVEADVLADNVAAQLLFATVFPDMTIEGEGPEVTITAPLPPERRSPTRPCPSPPCTGRLGRRRPLRTAARR